MLERAGGLSSRALQAIAELERRVTDADGGRLKLEWGTLRSRIGDRVEDLCGGDYATSAVGPRRQDARHHLNRMMRHERGRATV